MLKNLILNKVSAEKESTDHNEWKEIKYPNINSISKIKDFLTSISSGEIK